MELKKIGVIHSIYEDKEDAPRQGCFVNDESVIEVFHDYIEALDGLDKLKYIVVLYWGDRSDRKITRCTPPGTELERGVFATRSPNRPNPVALCICEVISVDKNKITVTGLDALNGSPLLDIKVFDTRIDVK